MWCPEDRKPLPNPGWTSSRYQGAGFEFEGNPRQSPSCNIADDTRHFNVVAGRVAANSLLGQTAGASFQALVEVEGRNRKGRKSLDRFQLIA
jgi:hypothetical protein